MPSISSGENNSGKTRGSYALVFIILLFFLLLAGPVAAASLPLGEGNAGYLVLFIPHTVTLCAAILLSLPRPASIVAECGDGSVFRWKLFFLSFLLYFIPAAAVSLISSSPVPNPAPSVEKLLSAAISILFLPLAALVEEYIFRVLLVRAAGMEKKGKWRIAAISLVSGLVFTLPHSGNTEVLGDGGIWAILTYFLWGAAASFISFSTGSFECAIAMHCANNLVPGIVVNTPSSTISSSPLFLSSSPSASPLSLVSTLLILAMEHMVTKRASGHLPKGSNE